MSKRSPGKCLLQFQTPAHINATEMNLSTAPKRLKREGSPTVNLMGNILTDGPHRPQGDEPNDELFFSDILNYMQEQGKCLELNGV